MPAYNFDEVEIYTKTNWHEAWVKSTQLVPLKFEFALPPEKSQATVALDLGTVVRGSSKSVQSPANLLGSYVLFWVPSQNLHWCGVISSSNISIDGFDSDGNYIGKRAQVFTCNGLEWLLDCESIFSTRVWNGTEEVSCERVISFNQRTSLGLSQRGNRSTEQHDGRYIFEPNSSSTWSILEIINYLRTLLHNPVQMTWTLTGDIAGLDQRREDNWNLDGLSLFEALNKMLPRQRGYAWSVKTDIDPTRGFDEDIVSINIVSTQLVDVLVYKPEFGGDEESEFKTFHANALIKTIDMSNYDDISGFSVVSSAPMFSTIQGKGSRVRSTFSVRMIDEQLVNAWTVAEANAYRKAGISSGLYEENAKANDLLRGDTSKYKRAFRSFKIHPDWNWRVQAGAGENARPAIIASLGITSTVDESVPYGGDLSIMPKLPLIEGVNYQSVTWTTTATEPEFLAGPMVWITDGQLTYHLATNIGNEGPDARVSVASRELMFDVAFSPPHLLAATHWPASSTPTLKPPTYTYDYMVATVQVELDEHLAYNLSVDDAPEYGATLNINVPDCHLWLLSPYTIIAISTTDPKDVTTVNDNPTGYETDLDGRILVRNDSWRLRCIVTLAKKYYDQEHKSVRLSRKRLAHMVDAGDLISTISLEDNHESVNSIVSRVSYDCQAQSMSFSTKWYDFNWSFLESISVPHVQDGKLLDAEYEKEVQKRALGQEAF